jgi:hypothetical protein
MIAFEGQLGVPHIRLGDYLHQPHSRAVQIDMGAPICKLCRLGRILSRVTQRLVQKLQTASRSTDTFAVTVSSPVRSGSVGS